MLGLQFAPLKIPLYRRLQTLSVWYFCYEFLFFSFWPSVLLVYLLWTPWYWLSLLYLTWFLYDHNVCLQGGRRWEWLRRASAWKYFAQFFPIELVKTAELPADRNYIFGCHPHGILCFSHFVNFATEGTNFSKKFPKLVPHLITLNYQFLLPFHRELFLFSGACSASKQSIEYLVSKKGKGNVVAIVIGGAAEVLDTKPDHMELTLKRRKGFVRLAMKHGASLVPVISFGENNLFNPLCQDIKLFRWFQEKMIKIVGYPIPLFQGRGIFQYSFGVLPFRKPITTVVGVPIDVQQMDNPTQEEIDQLHQRYIQALCELFEQHKSKYNCANVTLQIK